ncbi:MAG: Gfo/Idh/MocA family oxidoreductase [Pirellulales bacterium]|nr:Gfo/Idh/MocA family oxidoreductase [Pirellulales bacterium]
MSDPSNSARHDVPTQTTAAASVAAGLSVARSAHAAGSDVIKIALIGCGNRGTGACRESLLAAEPVRLVAVGDLFGDRVKACLANLTKYDELRPRIDVPQQRQFLGFDAHRKVLDAGVDLVLLATPPHFRPEQYAAAVKAGKHVFMEKPLCVDAPGYRTLLAANDEARKKKLSVVVGLQRRHQGNYLEGIQRIRNGEIGDVIFLRTYFNVLGGGRAGQTKPEGMSEMEYQIRYWAMFTWLGGDHIVEQSTHEIDVANWVMDGHPVRAQGMGGRQVRFGPGNGDFWDHHAVEFEYANGARLFAQARQQAATWVQVSDNVHGTKGSITLGSGPWGLGALTPRELRRRRGKGENPYQQEHVDLIASIRSDGPYCCEGDYGATSSMTAVMGRMATYSGQTVTWDEATQSGLKLGPERYALDADPPVLPDAQGAYPAAMPGVTKAW